MFKLPGKKEKESNLYKYLPAYNYGDTESNTYLKMIMLILIMILASINILIVGYNKVNKVIIIKDNK